MRSSALPLVASLACLAGLLPLAAQDALIEPGLRLAVIDTRHIHALVPEEQRARILPLVVAADRLYTRLARDAGYTISEPLNVFISDSVDTHNGYSFVTPYPLINVQLAPAAPASTIFTGEDDFTRTFIHEATHHITNDRSYGFRRVLESIFGRILPFDFLSAGVAYLSTPAHQTMPVFWHEGLAQWAETTYAPAGSAWSGRGRDSMTHMVWRLDADAGAIPPPGNWHYIYHRWPFGSEAYIYGIAYLRWLDRVHGGQVSPWTFAEHQAHQWAFCFDGAPRDLVQRSHGDLLIDARADLMREQQANLALLRRQPVTRTTRLTPPDHRLGAPCWTPDGRLFAALDDPNDHPRFAYVDARGGIDATWDHAFAMGSARSLADGTTIWNEIPSENDIYTRSRLYVRLPAGGQLEADGERMLMPDIRSLPAGSADGSHLLTAIHLAPGGNQELVVSAVTMPGGWFDRRIATRWHAVPTQGKPWAPAFRPLSDELGWVETDAAGSRLVLAPLSDPTKRTVLAQVRGRILHPAWSADGKHIFICADHTGVSNAWRIAVDRPGVLVPVTNTVGGVIACVPSFDGRELALIEHDRQGPYLARIANDAATWPQQVPTLDLAWPGDQRQGKAAGVQAVPTPAAGGSAGPGPAAPAGAAEADDPGVPVITPYHGLTEIRPCFWTPTMLPVPEGGWGVVGVALDPVQTHQIVVSAGVGPEEHIPVGLASWAYAGWPIDIAAVAWRSERTFGDHLITADGQSRDYTEQTTTGELRIGTGLIGMARRWQMWLAGGIANQQEVAKAADRYEGIPVIGQKPFQGHERYIEATLAYDGSMLFPMSYAPEDGPSLAVSARQSGMGGDFTGRRIEAKGSYVFSVIPAWGQQLVAGGLVGWSDGDLSLQGQFHTGGNVAYGMPRGYPTFQSTGAYQVGYSAAWRTPLLRPFEGHGTTPFISRQAVLELFYEGSRISDDHLNGDGWWIRSAGGEARFSFAFWETLFNPGIGWAKQIDGKKDRVWYLTLSFNW